MKKRFFKKHPILSLWALQWPYNISGLRIRRRWVRQLGEDGQVEQVDDVVVVESGQGRGLEPSTRRLHRPRVAASNQLAVAEGTLSEVVGSSTGRSFHLEVAGLSTGRSFHIMPASLTNPSQWLSKSWLTLFLVNRWNAFISASRSYQESNLWTLPYNSPTVTKMFVCNLPC